MIPFNHLGWIFKHIGPSIYPRQVRESLCSFLMPLSRSAWVLDLGAGTGIMSEFAYICRNDLQFTAVDPAEGMLKYSAAYIQTHKAHAESLPFEKDRFDAILIGEALHHFSDIERSIEEIVRVLKSEGRLFIYDFDSSTFMGKMICRTEKILGEPGNFFTPQDLKVKLESYGFCCNISKHGWRYTVDALLEK
jgi:demethylmenaquinone methyltransferase/2-methoxy-6-polyprenyl-1,4-benzoquinol methylase